MKYSKKDLPERFGWLYDNVDVPAPSLNSLLLNHEGVKTIPSLGSIVPGWTLTFPSVPMLNLSWASESERTKVIEQAARSAKQVETFDARIYHFEHGPCERGTEVGCGVDLAHLHTVPLKFDLIKETYNQTKGMIDWSTHGFSDFQWDTLKHKHYYLMWENASHNIIVGVPNMTTSQMFRRVIANALDKPQHWDYKDHQFEGNVSQTINAFYGNEY